MQFNFIQFLKQVPFSRIIFPFTAGIIIALNFSFEYNYLLYLLILILITFLFSIRIIYTDRFYKKRWIPGFLINCFLILSGIVLTQVNRTEKFHNYSKENFYEAIISEPVTEKDNSYKSILKNIKYISNDSLISESSEAVVYFSKNDVIKKLKYGDKVIFKGRINEITNPGNPHEFNYKRYLFRKNISGQVFLKSGQFKIVEHYCANPVFDIAYNTREKFEKIYEKYGISGNELSVLQALTLGDRSDLDDSVRQSFVASGAMHILAVSGLHVGIIFMLFNFLLKFLDKIKYKEKHIGTWFKAALLIIIIWSFAILSGLSPSIRRAAIMFSVIIIGKALNRHINIYNSVAASALILLIINPYQITEVGFQLSYAAVLGIIFFQPKIVAWFTIKNKILYYLWSLTAVSIAAQIATFPITLYYFHIFPTFFFLSNIIVIPAATIILISAFFLLVSSKLPIIPDFIALILKKILIFLNTSVSYIEKIPYSTFENISFHNEDLIMAFLFIISTSVFILLKRVKALQISLIFLIIWISSGSFRKISTNSKTEIFIYNINKYTAIDITGEQNFFISDKSIFETKNIIYGIHPNRRYLNKKDFQFIPIDTPEFKSENIYKKNDFIIAGNKTFLLLTDRNRFLKKTNINFDYVILSGKSKVKISDLKEKVKFKKLILDSSNKFYQLQNRKEACNKQNIDYYSVSDSGAFNLTF